MAASTTAKKCFVITPMGHPKDTPERFRMYNLVMNKLIDPAIALANRKLGAGHEHAALHARDKLVDASGRIDSAIIRAIMEDDVLIGVLFEDNPNVFYELGIAEMLGRPIIFVKEDNYPKPFDLSTYWHIIFRREDLESGNPVAAVEELCKAVLDMLAAPAFRVPFQLADVAPPARVFPYDRFNANSLNYQQWSQMLADADREIWLAGTTLLQLFETDRFILPAARQGHRLEFRGSTERMRMENLLLAACLDGVDVEILIMHEDSPVLPRMICVPDGRGQDDFDRKYRKVRMEIEDTTAIVRKAQADLLAIQRRGTSNVAGAARLSGRLRLTKIHHRMLTHRVTMSEKYGLVTPIFYHLALNSGPCFRVSPRTGRELHKSEGGAPDADFNLYKQIRDDLKLHVEENWSICVANGEIVEEASTLAVDLSRQAS